MAPVPSFIGDFSDDDITWVIENGIQQHVAPGRELITEGEEIDAVYVVLEGTFVVSSAALGIAFLSRLGPGEIAGEMSFIRGVPPIGTVRAETDATVLEIPRERLRAKIAKDEAFAGRFHRVVAGFTTERWLAFRNDLVARRQKQDPAGPSRPAGDVEPLRVYELIERMLRGDFPEA